MGGTEAAPTRTTLTRGGKKKTEANMPRARWVPTQLMEKQKTKKKGGTISPTEDAPFDFTHGFLNKKKITRLPSTNEEKKKLI